MDIEQIETDSDFITFLRDLSSMAADYSGSLEEYLRGVLSSALIYREEPASWQLLAQILKDGLTAPPAPFDPAWLEYTDPPDLITKREALSTGAFATAQHMLCYEIADLHRMAETGTINHPYRYYRIDSPTVHSWCNFDLELFIECASAGMGDGDEDTACSWGDLVVILHLGQDYE